MTPLSPALTYQTGPLGILRTILKISPDGTVHFEETDHSALRPKRQYLACTMDEFKQIAGPSITVGTPPTLRAKAFCFNSRSGGTGISTGLLSTPAFAEPTAAVTIFRGFFDYEAGWRFIGIAADPAIESYLDSEAAPGFPLVYVSEFELSNHRDLFILIEHLEQQAF